MTGSCFKFMVGDAEEFGFGTEEEAFEYAAILNSHCENSPEPKRLNEAQAAGLVVLVTPNTFIVREALTVLRSVRPLMKA